MTISERQLANRRARNARGLDEVVLDCRLIGHMWKRVADTNETPPMFGVRICYECKRCESGRCDIVQRSNGDLLHRSYQYTEGYHLDSIEGERPVNAPVLRMETIRRLDQTLSVPGVPEVES